MFSRCHLLVLSLLLALLTSACMDGPALPASSTIPIDASAATATAAASEEAASDADTGNADTSQGEPRVITHIMGDITLPATPQRIVVLEWTYVEALLSVGIQPTGVADIEGYHSWVKIPVELGPEVVDVGTRQAPNLELIATLQPDLIIATAFRVTDSYDELSALAPTLVFDNYPADETHYENMRQTFTTIADIVGRQAEGDAVLAQMEAKFADARTQLEAAGLVGERFALAQAFSSDNQAQVRIFTDNALATQVVMQLGLENGWEDAPQPYGFSTVSVEALPELGDLHFFYVVQEDDNVFASTAITPLWENLEFVQNDHAYALGGGTWLFGGPLSVELLVDVIMDALITS